VSTEPLNYIVYTTPDPLQVGPQNGTPNDPSLATLTIVVSNSKGQAVECQSISFNFLQGTNARDFFSDSTGIATSAPTGWGLTQDGSIFTAKPDTPQDGNIGPDGVVFTISRIKVNNQPGTTGMTVVQETSSGTATLSIPLAKFPQQFTVGDLKATPDTVEQGGNTTLTWSGSSGATYEIHYTDGQGELVSITHPKDDPNDLLPSSGSYEIDNLQANTTFYLSVTLTTPGGDDPPMIERTFPVTVQIPPVHIVSFTGETQYNFDQSSSSPRTAYALLSWNVSNANQVLLDGNVVDGNSATVLINGDTQFTLGAIGSPNPVYKTITVSATQVTAQISVRTANSVQASIDAPDGNYALNWSVDWVTGETAGTATSSSTMQWAGDGGWVEIWGGVPMDQPPPYGQITAARYTITTLNGASATDAIRTRPAGVAVEEEEEQVTSAGGTLLAYAVQTTPDPLQASPQTGDPSLAALTIIVANQKGYGIKCQSISFSFLQGTNARDFFSDSTGIATSAPKGWSISQEGSLFTATPETAQDGEIGPAGLVFFISNIPVNDQPGTTEMIITEVTSSKTGTLSIPLAKFPPQFYVGEFKATPDTVEQGGSTVLTWGGAGGANYEIHYTDAQGELVSITHPVNEPDKPLPSSGSYQINDLQKTTTFYLSVTLAVEGSDKPVSVERSFPVTVDIPNVQILSFTAEQSLPQLNPGSPPSVAVTLSWEVAGASQVLLSGNVVEGNSAVVSINETTTFTLEASGSPWPVYQSLTVAFAVLSPPSGNSVEVTLYAPVGTYDVDWNLEWETGETSGVEVNSMRVTTNSEQQSIVWSNVPMPPNSRIVAVRCYVAGLPNGPSALQWLLT
jgi:hypothetical protein